MAFDNGYTAVTGATYAASDYNTYTKGNFTAIWVGTTAGDMEYYTSSTAKSRLAKGSAYQVLRMNSGATAPEWGGYIAGMAYRGTAQSISTGTLTKVTFASTTILRSVTWSGGDPTKLTIDVTGLYVIGFTNEFDDNGGTGYRQSYIKKNNTTYILQTRLPPISGDDVLTSGATLALLTSGDYLQLEVAQNTGSSMNLNTSYLFAVFVGV